MQTDIPCPCGSGRAFAVCCGPALSGERLPESAEALMRSRFTAFVRGDVAYLRASWHPSTRPVTLNLTDQPIWERLEIVRCEAGTPGDDAGGVEFITHFRSKDGVGRLHESSRFTREQGKWFYVDGVQPTVAAGKPGRNAPCPCGSGRKYKHCCGR